MSKSVIFLKLIIQENSRCVKLDSMEYFPFIRFRKKKRHMENYKSTRRKITIKCVRTRLRRVFKISDRHIQ